MNSRGWSKRLQWSAGALALFGAVLALAVLGLRPTPGGDAGVGEPPGGARAAAHGKPTAHELAAAAVADEPELPAQRPLPDCWTGLERTQEARTLADFRAAVQPLLAAQPPDELLGRYLQERLVELIGSDEARGLEALEAALSAGPAEAELLLAGLRGSEAVQKPAVAQRLVSLALDEHLDLGVREGLLLALDTQRSLPPAAIDALAAFAKDERSGEAAMIATRTLGRVMAEDFQRSGKASAYTGNLLSVAAGASDEQVRAMALELPMVSDVRWSDAEVTRLSAVLTGDGSEDVRELAAQNLALGQDKQKVLAQFEAAFSAEQDACVRWALFRFAARAAGKQALPAMSRMAAQDPRFAASERAFEQAYANGVRDFERVWLGLADPDPLGCLHRDGDGT